MPRRHLFLIGLFSVLLALGLLLQRQYQKNKTPPPTSQATVSAASPSEPQTPLRFRWALGQRRTYALFQERTIRFRQNPTPAEKRDTDGISQDSFRIAVRGNWNITTVRADAFSVLAEVAITDPTLELGQGQDREQVARLKQALAAPFFLRMEPTGKLVSLRVSKTLGAFERGFLQGLAATLQYVRGSGFSWTSDELDAMGEYRASYALSSDQRICEKKRLRYTRVATEGGLLPVENLGRLSGSLKLRYDLSPGSDESARIEQCAGHESLEVDPGAGMPQVGSESEVSLRLLSTTNIADSEARAARAESEDFESVLLGQQERDPNHARRADEQTVKGARFEDLLTQLLTLSGSETGAQRAELLLQLAALSRLDPETAKKAQTAIAQGVTPQVARTLIGALGSAGTKAAQSALTRLAETPSLSTDLRSNAVAMLGLSEHPEDETTLALSQLANDKDPDVRGTAALAMGNAALAQRRAGQTGESEHAVDELLAKLQAATTLDEQLLYLQAIGNTGDPRALAVLQTALSATEIDVRAAAVTALRFIPGEAVDQLIATTLLRDIAAAVRKSAVFAASHRSLLAMLSPLRQAVQSDLDAAVRSEILPVLGRALAVPGVVDLLREVAARDASPDVRKAAAALLAGGTR